MWGLLYKDLMVLKKDLLTSVIGIFFFSLPLFAPWGELLETSGGETELFNGETLVFVILPIFVYFCVFNVISTVTSGIFAQDERRVWSSYVTASPLGQNGQVLSKYYLAFGLTFVGYVWGVICDSISSFVLGVQGSAMMIYTVFFFFQIAWMAFEIPFIIRFGQKHGTIYKILAVVVIFFIVFVYVLFGKLPEFVGFEDVVDALIGFMDNPELSSTVMLGVVACLPYVILLLYYLSYKLSCRLYQKGVSTYEA